LPAFKPSLIFEVTDQCDCRCSFCYEQARRQNRSVTPADFARALSTYHPLYLQITGGEALLHPEFEELIRLALRTVPVVQISTNGTQLERRLAFLAGLKRKPLIGISLDFPDERHDRVRKKKGLFKKIRGILPKMKEAGIPTAFSTTVFGPDAVPEAPEGNLDELADLIGFSAAHDLPINIQAASPARTEVRQELGRRLLSSNYRKLVNSPAYAELLVNGHDGRCRFNWTNVSIGVDASPLPTQYGNCYFCKDCLRCYYSCVWEPTLLASRHLPRLAAHFFRMQLHMTPAVERILSRRR
jgi:molybdenum cofactor biosynthesis enzyme MoaA